MTPAICAEGRDDHHPEKRARFASRAFIPQAGALFSDPRQTSEQFIRVSLMVLELPESFYSPFDQFRNFCRLAGCQSALGNRVQDCRARRHRVGWAFDLGQVERNRTVTPHWCNPIEDDLCRRHIAEYSRLDSLEVQARCGRYLQAGEAGGRANYLPLRFVA